MGVSKSMMEKIIVAKTKNSKSTKICITRYGNVMGSRGSVIPFFLNKKGSGILPITDKRMTRFMITLDEGVKLVWHAFQDMLGGEIYVKKIPSIKITDIAKAIAPQAKIKIIGIRPGEKLHEQMIGIEDSPNTFEYKDHFKILPAIHNWAKDTKRIKNGKTVNKNFSYSSDKNQNWMTISQLSRWVEENKNQIELT